MHSRTDSSVEAHRPSPELLSGHAAWIVLLVVLSASFMDMLDANIVTVAAPAIGSELDAGPAQLQWIVAAYVLALGSGLITGGRLGDDYGRRRIFLSSLAVFAVASAACALATGPAMLIVTRILQGLASGLMVPQVFGIIRSSLDPARMARAFGAFGAVTGLAVVAGPLLGGGLVDADLLGLGWRTIFWVNVPIAVIAIAVGVWVLPESRMPNPAALDVTGAALSTAAVLFMLLPLIQGRDWEWPWWGFVIIGLGVSLLGCFCRYEQVISRRGGRPVLEPSLLRVPSFRVGLLVSLFFYGAIGPFFLTLSLYLQVGTGRSAWQTGLVVFPYAIGTIVTSSLGSVLSGRGGRAPLIGGALLLAASQVVMWLIVRNDGTPGYWPLAVAMLVGGLGLGLASPILVNVVLAGLPGEHASSAGGALSTVNQIGSAAGVAVIGTLFFAIAGQSNVHASPVHTYGHAFAAVVPIELVLYVLAAALMLLLPRRGVPDQQ